MSRRALVVVVVFLGVAGAGVLFAGESDFGGDFGSSDVTDAPSATVSSGTTATESASDTVRETNEESDETPPTTTGLEYAFAIERVENCGTTCRDVTARLTNSGGETRENVRVTTTVLADGEVLWSGNETVGTLASGQSHVSTERVEVGFSGGLQLRANDGYVTIVTEVRSESGTTRFSERRKVA